MAAGLSVEGLCVRAREALSEGDTAATDSLLQAIADAAQHSWTMARHLQALTDRHEAIQEACSTAHTEEADGAELARCVRVSVAEQC